MFESLFDKVAGISATLLKETPKQAFSSKYWEILRNSFKRTALFIEHLWWLLLLYAFLQNFPSLPIILLLAIFLKLISLQTFNPIQDEGGAKRPPLSVFPL